MKNLVIDNISMNYHTLTEETKALKNITFSVKNNDFVSIVGPSGCGKSTILNIIAGLLIPSKGSVHLDDIPINGYNNKISYMFQKDHLFDWLTVWKNVILGLKVQKKLNEERISNAENLLKRYNLWDFKDMYPKQLSGGMRQRVALIRTLAINPELLLLDEPFSALDYQTRLNISNEVFKIIKKESKTAIMVTHDISEAISLSSKIIILSNRPSEVKKVVNISFDDNYSEPLLRRQSPKFKDYFNLIWKELNNNE